jgi:hypothetical protein
MSIVLYQPITFGDTSGHLGNRAHAADQIISIGTNSGPQTLVGDALSLVGRAVGGDDTLGGGGMAPIIVIGDAVAIAGRARGGDDDVTASGEGGPIALGDAITLSGQARGGDDSVSAIGGSLGPTDGTAYGDSETITGRAKGGDDLVRVGLGGTAYGDAQTLSGFAIGGDDTFIGSLGIIPGWTARMYGDGAELLGRSKGGNDTLISGEYTNDQMWGDAALVARTARTGADTFVFSPHNGQDTIMDFQPKKDHIELKGFGFTTFDDVASHLQSTPDGALIAFDTTSYGVQDTILVIGVGQLNASDFILS